MSTRFGLSVAIATPFDADGKIAIPALIAQARHCLSGGCGSITLFGTTGEGTSVGMQEREETFAALIAAGIAGNQIVAGVLVNAAEDAVTQARHALRLGARNVLLAPPSYFKNVGDDGVFGWFETVFTQLGTEARDVILYNIPQLTMVTLSVALVGRLRAAFPEIVVGVKDSAGNWPHTEALLKAHGDLIILIGDERHLARGVRLGGQGAISGMANLLPRELKRVAEEGNEDTRLTDFVEELVKHPVIPTIKALIADASGDPNWAIVRAPLASLPAAEAQSLGSMFFGLFRPKAA